MCWLLVIVEKSFCESFDIISDITEFTEGHQYWRTDGLVGTGLMPYKAHSPKYQHFMSFPVPVLCRPTYLVYSWIVEAFIGENKKEMFVVRVSLTMTDVIL